MCWLNMDSETGVQIECINADELTMADKGAASGEMETQSVTKRSVKLTQKALLDELETLQKTKSKLNKASTLKIKIQELMQDRKYETEVHCTFDEYTTLCDEAKEIHTSLLKLLPPPSS